MSLLSSFLKPVNEQRPKKIKVHVDWELPKDKNVKAEIADVLLEVLDWADRIEVKDCDMEGFNIIVDFNAYFRFESLVYYLAQLKPLLRYVNLEWEVVE